MNNSKQESVEEIMQEFTQYCDDGYSGGKDGLRCNDCDRKYRGQAQVKQLCPVCNVRQTLEAERQAVREEMLELFIHGLIKEHQRCRFSPLLDIASRLDSRKEEIIKQYDHEEYGVFARMRQEIDEALAERQSCEEMVEMYDEIFKWLLGEKGDFPDLSQKPHYSFRTELRAKLTQPNNPK